MLQRSTRLCLSMASWCCRGLPVSPWQLVLQRSTWLCLTMPVGVAEVYLALSHRASWCCRGLPGSVSPCQLVLQRSTCLTVASWCCRGLPGGRVVFGSPGHSADHLGAPPVPHAQPQTRPSRLPYLCPLRRPPLPPLRQPVLEDREEEGEDWERRKWWRHSKVPRRTRGPLQERSPAAGDCRHGSAAEANGVRGEQVRQLRQIRAVRRNGQIRSGRAPGEGQNAVQRAGAVQSCGTVRLRGETGRADERGSKAAAAAAAAASPFTRVWRYGLGADVARSGRLVWSVLFVDFRPASVHHHRADDTGPVHWLLMTSRPTRSLPTGPVHWLLKASRPTALFLLVLYTGYWRLVVPPALFLLVLYTGYWWLVILPTLRTGPVHCLLMTSHPTHTSYWSCTLLIDG